MARYEDEIVRSNPDARATLTGRDLPRSQGAGIVGTMATLRDRADELEAVIAQLHDTLAPLLRPAPTETEAGPIKAGYEGSEHVGELEGLSRRLTTSIRTLRHLTERIDF